MKSIEQVLTEMLTESTGKHPMDSGKIYGRHWEENQKNGIKTGYQICDFYIDKEDKTCELIPTIPIFDAFKETLEYTEECIYLESLIPSDLYSTEVLYWIEEQVNYKFAYERLNDLINNRYINSFYNYKGFNPQLLGSTINYANNLLHKVNPTIFEENEYVGTVITNSYDDENLFLSQNYASIFFEYECESYIAISIHNGCDIRGGYTNVHIFKVSEDDFLNARSDVSIECYNGDKVCNNGYQMYGFKEYYSYKEQTDVDEQYIYQNTYVDEDGKLRCKNCNGLIVCHSVTY